MPDPELDPFLTVPEIARELRYSEMSVRKWIQQGKLTAIQATNREYRVRRSALDAMISTTWGSAKTRRKANDGGAPSEPSLTARIGLPVQAADEVSLIAQVRLPDER